MDQAVELDQRLGESRGLLFGFIETCVFESRSRLRCDALDEADLALAELASLARIVSGQEPDKGPERTEGRGA